MGIKTKKRKRRAPRLFRQAEVEKAWGKILRSNIPFVVNKDSFDKLTFKSENERATFERALTLHSRAILGLSRLHTTYDDMVLLYRMAQVFPWDERLVTRTQHLHFMWLLFVNHCYLIEERFKLAAKAHNDALKAFGVAGGVNIKAGVKQIGVGLKKHIQSRGEQTHQWRRTHDIVADFGVIELANSLAKIPGLPRMKVVRAWPKMLLSIEMGEAIGFVESFLIRLMEVHAKELLPLSSRLNRVLKQVRKSQSKDP